MIDYKSEEEILRMREGGARLRKVVSTLLPEIKVGQTTEEIDKRAEELIIKEGGQSSFKKVKGYKWSTCLTINEQVVHTPPSSRRLADGDVLTVDIGMFYQGFHTDFATTVVVGEKSDQEKETFLEAGKQTLKAAIGEAKSGQRIGHISAAIEKGIETAGYFIMKDLTGHGVGRELHEDPFVPGYVDGAIEKSLMIKPGLVIAIEVIYSKGTEKIKPEPGNDWSIISADRSLTACFEHSVAITKKGTLILT